MRRAFLLAAVVILLVPVTAATTTFGDPATDPLPNITDVRIYDVTSDATPRDGGTLEASGVNTTLTVTQSDVERRYRVAVRINNTGADNFTVDGSDELFHQGLNATWTVGDIWYNISTTRDGGTFSGGTVTWNTSNGGELEPDAVMWANYLVNVSQPRTSTYDLRMEVNDTGPAAGSYDLHDLQVEKLGWLNVTLLEPPNDTVVKQNDTFTVNASVTCQDGDCGTVNATPRYNATGDAAGTVIPQDTGTPFHTVGPNAATCDTDLAFAETCHANFTVNATGDVETAHALDVNASSDTVAANDSTDHLVRINAIILMSLTFDTVRFGAMNPGETDRAAIGNQDLAYNVTFDADSIDVDALWVKASPLVSQQDASYTVGPSNLTTTADPGTTVDQSETYTRVASDIAAGSTVNTFHYLDMPYGMLESDYNGTMTFKANATR